jgi:phosphatidylglycerophosphate synthase
MEHVSDVTALARLADSRAATDTLLGVLRAGRWSPRACRHFAELAVARSVHQAVGHRRALVELTALHAAIMGRSRGRGRGWAATSWLLAIAHLGLLEGRDRLSPADMVTLCRANLPAFDPVLGRWAGVAAIATDVADGRLARRQGTVSPFGAYADHLADAVFWTWLAFRHEPSRALRIAALAAWAAPVVAVTATSVARGRMAAAPRHAVLRPAVAMQVVIALRHLAAGSGPRRVSQR